MNVYSYRYARLQTSQTMIFINSAPVIVATSFLATVTSFPATSPVALNLRQTDPGSVCSSSTCDWIDPDCPIPDDDDDDGGIDDPPPANDSHKVYWWRVGWSSSQRWGDRNENSRSCRGLILVPQSFWITLGFRMETWIKRSSKTLIISACFSHFVPSSSFPELHSVLRNRSPDERHFSIG